MFGRHPIMERLYAALRNPHLLAGAVIARLAVNLATLLWAIVVVSKTDALTPFPGYHWMLEAAPENVWGALLGFVAVFQTYRLIIHAKPFKYGPGYALMTLFWMYIWWSIVVNTGPIWPAAFACVTAIVALSLFAFISNPKRPHDDYPG